MCGYKFKEGFDVQCFWIRRPARLVAGLLLSFLVLSPLAAAQVRPPRPPDVRPPTPRLADGQPNLGRVDANRGYWSLQQHRDYADVLLSLDEIPYQPWARELAMVRRGDSSRDDPQGYCLPPVGPRLMTTPYPMEIIQIPNQERILMIYEGGAHIWREIYMDGREHPEGDALNPTWLGYSVGHWDGDILVIEARGFNEKSWIDMLGDPHTDQLRITERYSRPDLYTLRYEATLDDPGAYTEPWAIGFDIIWDPEGEMQEYICQENNQWSGGLLW